MIDHLGISVGSIARATEFYLKALAPLGYGIVMEVSAEETGHGAAIAFGAPGHAADFQSGKPSFWSVRARRRAGPCMSPSWLQAVPPSMFSIMPRSRQGALTTGRQVSGPNTTPPITPPSCSILTATISKPYATALNESRRARPPGGASVDELPIAPRYLRADLASNQSPCLLMAQSRHRFRR